MSLVAQRPPLSLLLSLPSSSRRRRRTRRMIRARASQSSRLVYSTAVAVSCALNCACVHAYVYASGCQKGRQAAGAADNLRFRNSYHCITLLLLIGQYISSSSRVVIWSGRVGSKSPDAWAKQSKSKHPYKVFWLETELCHCHCKVERTKRPRYVPSQDNFSIRCE